MIGRIVPYYDVFISLTLTLDEAARLNDLVGSLKLHKDQDVQKTAEEFRKTLEENLERAIAYKQRRGL